MSDDTKLSDQIQSVRTLPRERTFADEPVTERKSWLVTIGYGVAGILIVLLSAYIGWNVYDRYLQPRPQLTPIQIRMQAQAIAYDELLQNTEAHVGELVKVRGTLESIYQTKEGALLVVNVGGEPQTFADAFMMPFQNVLVAYEGRPLDTRTTVNVYGYVKGRKPFLSPVGVEFQWPELKAVLVE